MTEQTKADYDIRSYINGMDDYIKSLKKQLADCPEEARREAQKALQRTHVLTEDGQLRKRIVDR